MLEYVFYLIIDFYLMNIFASNLQEYLTNIVNVRYNNVYSLFNFEWYT